jgi:nicotinamidase/pyrazinamidase
MRKTALIVVDVQRDFCAGGALAASETPTLIAPLQNFIEKARRAGALIVFTQDWHPESHNSFQKNGGQWPVHCVAHSHGAELMAPLHAHAEDVVIHKGVAVNGAGYSGFEATELAHRLGKLNIEHVGVVGIATEYCVRATALDAAKSGFDTAVVSDLIRPVRESETPKILEELREAGVQATHSEKWLEQLLS